MSLDLVKEFASPKESRQHLDPAFHLADTKEVEEDEFGDFEDPGRKESLVDGTSAATAIPLDKEDEWGAFQGHTVFFDADQIDMRQEEHVAPVPNLEKDLNDTSKAVYQSPVVPSNASPNTAAIDEIDSEDWPEPSQCPIVPAKPLALGGSVEPRISHKMAKLADAGPPPSNVPPPSVLLPLVAIVFHSLAADVKMVVSSGFDSPDHSNGPDQASIYQIKDALSTARAGARIIAGRKLRWKRDTILSQSMRIGPAGGKIGGMKLAGLDKTESRREDAEAAEAVHAWKQQVGGLRSAVTTAKLQINVPDITETIPIRVMRPSEGAVAASKCCFLCGIKRDERVAKVDVQVEDSFGEWWTEHWGHVDCCSFWADHKGSLNQR